MSGVCEVDERWLRDGRKVDELWCRGGWVSDEWWLSGGWVVGWGCMRDRVGGWGCMRDRRVVNEKKMSSGWEMVEA